VAFRSARLVNTQRAARENEAARLEFGDAGGRQVVAHKLAKDVQIAHPAGDELPVLRTEVQDQHGVSVQRWLCGHFHLPPNSCDRFVAASTASISAARSPPRS